jgi:hypothetical protein
LVRSRNDDRFRVLDVDGVADDWAIQGERKAIIRGVAATVVGGDGRSWWAAGLEVFVAK